MKSNRFSCLGSSVPPEIRPPINIEKPNELHSKPSKTKQNKNKTSSKKKKRIYSKSPQLSSQKSDDQKQLPAIPSLNAASKSLLTSEPFVTSFINHEYQFVFRSRPIESCKYEPYKILLFIASAQEFDISDTDPRLSPDGVSQCKIVSSALRKAKQSRPHLIYCSTMYRALSTMQLVCPDWYDDNVKIIALDQLRPRIIKNKKNKRSNINSLKPAFKNVSFEYIDNNEDTLWNQKQLECEDLWKQRIHEFLTKFLVPQNELIKTEYGTIKCCRLENIGWNPDSLSKKKDDTPDSTSIVRIDIEQQNKYTALFKKRVVVVSHCEFFEYLMKHVMDDVPAELCKKWKHCDLRKIFVYTKQQLGILDIPYKHNHQRGKRKKNKNKKIRSRTPNQMNPKHKKANSETARNKYSQYKHKNNGIATTSKGDILMTNDNNYKNRPVRFPFHSHTFTLTSESAALLNKRKNKNIENDCGLGIRMSAEIYKGNNEENKYNDDGSSESKHFEPDENKNENYSKQKQKQKHVIVVTPPEISND